jgi:flagellar biosynthetic protein FliQ
MNPSMLVSLVQDALWLMVLTSAPSIISSLFVGLLVSVFQATTQLQENTLSAVPKLAAAIFALAVAGPWIGGQLVRFAADALLLLPRVTL